MSRARTATMGWEIDEEEVRRLLALPAAERAVLFFQLVADWEEAWGLEDAAGWVVSQDANALPLWPHAAFAEACAHGPWQGALPAAFALSDLEEDLIASLEADGLGVAVFPSPNDPGILLAPSTFRERLAEELEIGEV